MPADDATAQLVAGRYRLDQSLGAGGSGRVWSGEDTVLQRPVAIKAVELSPYLSEEEREVLRTRVLREARAAARIDHAGTVRMFDVVDEGDTVHLVMELVSAPTLSEVADKGFLTPEQTAAMGVELLDALTAAHAADIVHRDVKPRNVMVLPDGHVKLADFGIATVKDDPRITSTGMVLGTPSYMSPEQARGEPASTASDLWGLGATLYYAVEGVSPFDRGEPLPTLNAVLHDEPRTPVRAGPLGPVLLSFLAKNPAERPTAPEARRLLEGVAAGAAPTAPDVALVDPALETAAPATAVVRRFEPPAPAPAPPPPPTEVDVPAAAPSGPPTRAGRGWLAALAAVVLVAAVVGVVLARSDDDGGDGTEVAGVSSTTEAPADGQPAAVPETTTTVAAPAETEDEEESADDEEEPSDAPVAAGVPADWVTYEGDTGYTIVHPADWQPRPGSGNQVDFVDPQTGAYLRVDYVSPPGPDAVQAWEDYEPSFASRFGDYQRIRIEPQSFGDLEGAIWEYTYAGQHATNLAILTEEFGFALNFVADEERWDELADVRESFEAGFRPPT